MRVFALDVRQRPSKSVFLLALACSVAVSLLAVSGVSLRAADVELGEHTVLRFADVREGIEAITVRDDYIRQMSPFDRQVRLKTDRAVSEDELIDFISQHVRPWSGEEIAKLLPRLTALAKKLKPWKLALPPVVLLVKTDGREEGGAAYCRGAAIVLPQNMVDGKIEQLDRVLAHEVFHVLSNQNPTLRDELYQIIGFKPCNEVALPPSLAARKITNPDAPVNNHYITVTQGGRQIDLLPILLSKSEHYDVARNESLFRYLSFKLMQLANDNGIRRPALQDGKPVLYDPPSVPGFGEQIGRNTTYIIHPEEVLADNFVFLVNGRIDLPTQRIVEAMGRVLQGDAQVKRVTAIESRTRRPPASAPRPARRV